MFWGAQPRHPRPSLLRAGALSSTPFPKVGKIGVPDVASRTSQDQKDCCARVRIRKCFCRSRNMCQKKLVSEGRVPASAPPPPPHSDKGCWGLQGAPEYHAETTFRFTKYRNIKCPILFEIFPKDNEAKSKWHWRDFEGQLNRKRNEIKLSISF
jgi:hypothetical protein